MSFACTAESLYGLNTWTWARPLGGWAAIPTVKWCSCFLDVSYLRLHCFVQLHRCKVYTCFLLANCTSDSFAPQHFCRRLFKVYWRKDSAYRARRCGVCVSLCSLDAAGFLLEDPHCMVRYGMCCLVSPTQHISPYVRFNILGRCRHLTVVTCHIDITCDLYDPNRPAVG